MDTKNKLKDLIKEEKANVNALMDSVYAIDQALQNEEGKSKQQVLKANVGHIELQLGKEIYQEALTQEQKDSLTDAVTRAKAAYTPEEETTEE
jgi:hypothetical protein